MTGYICSYSVKTEMIISIYNNRRLTMSNIKNKTHYVYYLFLIFQLVLLILWTLTNEGIGTKLKYINNVGRYTDQVCSTGDPYIINLMFITGYLLLMISIINTYRGRNSKL